MAGEARFGRVVVLACLVAGFLAAPLKRSRATSCVTHESQQLHFRTLTSEPVDAEPTELEGHMENLDQIWALDNGGQAGGPGEVRVQW